MSAFDSFLFAVFGTCAGFILGWVVCAVLNKGIRDDLPKVQR